MGTWGTGPFDCDAAGDMLARIADPIRKVAKMKSDDRASYHYLDARAACALIVHAHGRDILGGTDLDLVLGVLQRIRADEQFINAYKDPKKIAAALDAEIENVKLAKQRVTTSDKIRAKMRVRKRDRKPNVPNPRYELRGGEWVLAPWETKKFRGRKRWTTKGNSSE